MKRKIIQYRKIKDNILAGAGSGLVAGMIFVSSATSAYADVVDPAVLRHKNQASITGMHVMRRWNSPSKINNLAGSLGLDQNYVKNELKSGKSLKQILQENGIDIQSLHSAFNKKMNRSWKRHNL